MKNLFTICSVLLLLISCVRENKYGVKVSPFVHDHFDKSDVLRTIKEKFPNYDICNIVYPIGYSFGTPRVLCYEIVYVKNGRKLRKLVYLGKVLTEQEEKEGFLRIN